MKSLQRFWADEVGIVFSAELVMVATTMVIGILVGMVSLRNQVVQELVSVGQAFGSLSQSYAFTPVQGTDCHNFAWTNGSQYIDTVHYCQTPPCAGSEPGGICLRDWGPFTQTPTYGKVGLTKEEGQPRERAFGCLQRDVCTGTWAALFQDYPASVLHAEARLSPEPTPAAPNARFGEGQTTKPRTLAFQLTVSIDNELYRRFQQQLLPQLESVAIRHGEWNADVEPRTDANAVRDPILPAGSRYEGLVEFKSGQGFKAGDWGTDQADLGKETLIVVNTLHDAAHGRTAWKWFNVPCSRTSVRSALKVKIEFLDAHGNAIGQQVVPLNLGCNLSPPGLEVFDFFNPREGDYRTLRTLGAKNSLGTAAVVSMLTKDPAHCCPADLLLMVSPGIAQANQGDPSQAFAARLVVPLRQEFTTVEAKNLKSIRATVMGGPAPL